MPTSRLRRREKTNLRCPVTVCRSRRIATTALVRGMTWSYDSESFPRLRASVSFIFAAGTVHRAPVG